MRLFLFLWVLLWAGIGSGQAQEQEPSDQAPADVQALAPPKAITILFGKYPIGPDHREVLLHVYVVPEKEKAPDRNAPYTREEFTGLDIPEGRFTADFLVHEGNGLKRVNRVSFRDVDGVNGVDAKWLEPRARRGPVIALHLGTRHWLGWQLIVFPEGISGPATLQYFPYGGEGAGGIDIDLDKVDRYGKMTVHEEWYSEEKGRKVMLHPWDGVEFADRYHPYFVIAASLKTRAEAEAFLQQHKVLEKDKAFIRPSNHYSKLTPGYFIIIAGRFEHQKEAEEYAKGMRKEGMECYVKRAF